MSFLIFEYDHALVDLNVLKSLDSFSASRSLDAQIVPALAGGSPPWFLSPW